VRKGTVYKRCGTCGRAVRGKPARCPHCGSERFGWAYSLNVAPEGAPRLLRNKGGFPTRSAANEALHALQEDLLTGRYVKPSAVTLRELARDYLKQAQVRDGTLMSQEVHCRVHLIPALGGV
jgi:hypothetical protein